MDLMNFLIFLVVMVQVLFYHQLKHGHIKMVLPFQHGFVLILLQMGLLKKKNLIYTGFVHQKAMVIQHILLAIVLLFHMQN